MNFGVIGFGKIARKFVKSIEYTDQGVIKAIASRSINKDDEYVRQHDVTIYNDYNELLEDKSIDAVYIALPHKYHKEWIIKAMKKNIAVLSEKPIVLNEEEMKEVIDANKQYQTYVMEAFKTPFNNGFEALKKDLSLIGKIKSIEANFCFEAVNDGYTYLFDKEQGGALNDVGSYCIGFVLALNKTPITNITSHIEIENDIEKYFKAYIDFEDGMQGIVEGAIDRNKERYAKIIGEKGYIDIPMYNRIIDYTIYLDNEKIERHYPINGDDMTLEIQYFINDVLNHQQQSHIHSLNDSLRIIEVTQQIRKNNI
jgi:predicted dehydrogenase